MQKEAGKGLMEAKDILVAFKIAGNACKYIIARYQ